jgi:hypothetical protein
MGAKLVLIFTSMPCILIYLFSSLPCDRSKASSKASSLYSAIQSFILKEWVVRMGGGWN